jgi:hypothetical protein
MLLQAFGSDAEITYKTFQGHHVPAGITFFIAAIALGRFWKIRSTQTTIHESTTRFPDGASKTAKSETKSEMRFMPSSPKD